MRSSRKAAATAAAIAVAVSVVALTASSASRADTQQVTARATTCPAGQTAVTYAGKTTCRAHSQALPQPRKGDQRLATLRLLLTSDWGNPPDLKKRLPPTLDDLLGDFGPGAATKARQAVLQIPATIDRLLPPLPARTTAARTSQSAAPCGPPPGAPPKTDSTTKDLGNGSSFDLHTSIGNGKVTAGFGIEGRTKDGSNRTVRWDVDFDLCDKNFAFSIPTCPTFEGKIDGSGKTRFTLKVTSKKDGKVEHYATVEVKHDASAKGLVAIDAKLDRVEIEDTYQTTVKSSGESIFWGPSSESGTVYRKATVDMRTGRYDLGAASVVDVKVSYTGILSIFTQDALAKARVSENLKRSSDETFAATVEGIVKEYKARETGWQTPNTCATLEFTPRSQTLNLRDGSTGQFTGKTVAKRSGIAKGRWRLVRAQNGSFTPPRVEDKQPSFSYRVTRGGARVSATYRVTSPAGVAQDAWTQNGADLPERFSGTFSGVNKVAGKNAFTGTITFVRDRGAPGATKDAAIYVVERVAFRVALTMETPCTATATATVSLGRQGRQSVLVISRVGGGQYDYAIAAAFQATTPTTIEVNCNGAKATMPWLPGAALNSGPGRETNGKLIKGTNPSPQTASTYNWNLKAIG